MILGDSYSTFCGYIPEGHGWWYSTEAYPDNKVQTVEDTWWWRVFSEVDGRIALNSSWTGTTVCHTGWGGEDCRHKSFISRFDKLIEDGYFKENKIDTLIVFGGTNDSWSGSPLGEVKFDNITDEDLYSFCPAVCYLAGRIKEALPNARVIFLVNAGLKDEINFATGEACRHYGHEILYLSMMDRFNNHPTNKGMKEIADELLSYLNK